MSIKSIGRLDYKQVNSLIDKLELNEFEFNKISSALRTGYIDVKYPKKNHPTFSEIPLPVGFILAEKDGKYDFELVNTDEKNLTNYHSRLKKIYNSVVL